MYFEFCIYIQTAIFFNWKTAWSIGPVVGHSTRPLQQSQTAVQFGAAGHGPVCFLSTVEFIWDWSHKHMNGPQCAGYVLTSPHQCTWDTLIKTGTHHGPRVFQRKPRPTLKHQCVDLKNGQICLTNLCHFELGTIAESNVHWNHLSCVYVSTASVYLSI